mmetsp:Transcript_10062/g.27344  ORF Transcript_10062/g.27344 Transcript_10062/m.27344 type:complete len:384 (+) Transcript_10062:963-2114(+)
MDGIHVAGENPAPALVVAAKQHDTRGRNVHVAHGHAREHVAHVSSLSEPEHGPQLVREGDQRVRVTGRAIGDQHGEGILPLLESGRDSIVYLTGGRIRAVGEKASCSAGKLHVERLQRTALRKAGLRKGLHHVHVRGRIHVRGEKQGICPHVICHRVLNSGSVVSAENALLQLEARLQHLWLRHWGCDDWAALPCVRPDIVGGAAKDVHRPRRVRADELAILLNAEADELEKDTPGRHIGIVLLPLHARCELVVHSLQHLLRGSALEQERAREGCERLDVARALRERAHWHELHAAPSPRRTATKHASMRKGHGEVATKAKRGYGVRLVQDVQHVHRSSRGRPSLSIWRCGTVAAIRARVVGHRLGLLLLLAILLPPLVLPLV